MVNLFIYLNYMIGCILERKTTKDRYLSQDDFKSKCDRLQQLRKDQIDRYRKRSHDFVMLLNAERQEELEKQKLKQLDEEIKKKIVIQRREEIQTRLEIK